MGVSKEFVREIAERHGAALKSLAEYDGNPLPRIHKEIMDLSDEELEWLFEEIRDELEMRCTNELNSDGPF